MSASRTGFLQELVAEPSVGAFCEGILRGLYGGDVVPAHFHPVRQENGFFHSVADLKTAINRFVVEYYKTPGPFIWRANPDAIITARNGGLQALETIHKRPRRRFGTGQTACAMTQ